MDNLTLTMKIAKPHTIDPLEGHTVVIFEQIGNAGEEFRFEIAPGQTTPVEKPTLFGTLLGRKPPNYFAYAVTGLPELRWQFTADVTLDSQTHTFTLSVTLAYSVSAPRMLVTRRNDDPIRKVREHIGGLLTRQFAQRTWLEVLQSFRTIERVVVASIIPLAQQYATYFGIDVHNIELSHHLTDDDIKIILEEEQAKRKEEEARREEELARVKAEESAKTQSLKDSLDHDHTLEELERTIRRRPLEMQVETFEQQRLAGRAYTDGLRTGLAAVAARIETIADVKAFGSLRSGGAHTTIENSRSDNRHLIAEGENSQSGAASVIAEALAISEQMALPRSEKQKLQSAILHLVAEMILDGEGTDGIRRHAEQIDGIRHEPKLSMEHADYLKQFVHFETLRDTLR